MGNSLLKFLCAKFTNLAAAAAAAAAGHTHHSAAPHAATDAVSVLSHDLSHFGVTGQVPDRLSQYVISSKKAQANWYRKLLDAWNEAKPPPNTPEAASRLVIQSLKRHRKADVEGILVCYGLPLPHTDAPVGPSSGPEGVVKYELQTLPVDAKAVADGDTITVYVDAAADPRESANVPRGVHEAALERAQARVAKDSDKEGALHKIITDAGYRVIAGSDNEQILARKYRIRLRGIDAPESSMPFGKEAKEELAKLVQGKCLKVYVHGDDRYGRCVGDVYFNSVYIQEQMLKKGLAWHYVAYDQRPELAKWEKEARARRVGLWASSHPEKPWEWRKERRNGT